MQNISSKALSPTLSVIKVRDTQIFMDNCTASRFSISLINAFNSQIMVDRSTF